MLFGWSQVTGYPYGYAYYTGFTLLIFTSYVTENLPLMHKDKYLEICDSIIQSISPEGLKLQTYLQFVMNL